MSTTTDCIEKHLYAYILSYQVWDSMYILRTSMHDMHTVYFNRACIGQYVPNALHLVIIHELPGPLTSPIEDLRSGLSIIGTRGQQERVRSRESCCFRA